MVPDVVGNGEGLVKVVDTNYNLNANDNSELICDDAMLGVDVNCGNCMHIQIGRASCACSSL